MIRKISKERIIEALAIEPLRSGDWHFNVTDNANRTCEVCAVGAILRQLKWNFSRRKAAALSGFVFLEKSNKYLESLSDEFESACCQLQDADLVRFHVINFVEGFFPKVLEVELD